MEVPKKSHGEMVQNYVIQVEQDIHSQDGILKRMVQEKPLLKIQR